MPAELMDYDHVPLGFEVVINNTDVEMGKIWNLWHNIRLTDNPQSWDSEVHLINKMQGRLGKLSTEQRLIRAHVAEFCRVCPIFPSSTDILCDEIGQDRLSNPVLIGCEGRELLSSLGYHDQESLKRQLRETVAKQIDSLENWLKNLRARTPTEFKVCGFLGKRTGNKAAMVEKIIGMVSSSEIPLASLRQLAEDICKETQGEAVNMSGERYRGRPFNCFGCLPREALTTKCQCSYSMLIDASLLCAGTSGEERSMLTEFKRFTEENILAHSLAINSWLTELPAASIEWLNDGRYVSKDLASDIARSVHSSLGEKNSVKEWLAACLLKTIKENQRWHKGAELIDNHPEATSYLAELH